MTDLYHVQHADRNVSYRDYAPGRTVLVTKIFYTLQGEGPFAGMPSVFVRLAGCNRGDKRTGCEFCDTDFRFAYGRSMAYNDVMLGIHKSIGAGGVKDASPSSAIVVISGGEPMIQNNTTWLVSDLVDKGYTVQIESNGDRLADRFAEVLRCHPAYLVVSPKVNKSSGQYQKLSDEVFTRANYLKFVVDARPESPYHFLPEYVEEFAKDKLRANIYVSPLTVYQKPVSPGSVASMWDPLLVDRDMCRANHKYAARLCLLRGFRLSMQQHLYTELE